MIISALDAASQLRVLARDLRRGIELDNDTLAILLDNIGRQIAARNGLPSGMPLTKRQGELLAYLQSYITEHGYAPSFDEIASHFGYCSLATVHEHLGNLEKKGHISRRYNEARGIALASTVSHV